MTTHGNLLLEKLNDDRKLSKRFCDITLKVKTVMFPAHRCVLSLFCGYFEKIFETNDRPISAGGGHGSHVVNVSDQCKDMSPKTMLMLLDYFYTEKIRFTVKNVSDVLVACGKLEIEKLRAEATRFLKTAMTSENWLEIYRISYTTGEKALFEACMESFGRLKDKLDTNTLQYAEFVPIIEHLQLKQKSTLVFELIMAWIKSTQTKQDRSLHFRDLLRYMDFDKMDTDFLQKRVSKEQMIVDSHDAMRALNDALLLQTTPREHKSSLTSSLDTPTPRESTAEDIFDVDEDRDIDEREDYFKKEVLIIGGDDERAKKSAVALDPDSKTFRDLADSPLSCSAAAVASLGEFVYVVGGQVGGKHHGHIQVYNAEANTWKVRHSVLKTVRCNTSAAIIRGKLYLVGGRKGAIRLNTVEIIAVDGNECRPLDSQRIANLKQARSYHAVVARQNILYVLGGYGGENRLRSCEAINVVRGNRFSIKSLHKRRNALAAVLYDDHIIAAGGFENTVLSSVEMYSFETRSWTYLPALKTPRWGHCACVCKGKVFVIGGKGLDTIEHFEFDTEIWTQNITMEVRRRFSSAVPI